MAVDDAEQTAGATAVQLDMLRRCVSELEAMVGQVEAVAPLLYMDCTALKNPKHTATGGVSRLASELAEEITSDVEAWRARREQDNRTKTAALEQRLRETVANRQREVDDRLHVRRQVQAYLYQQVDEALGRGRVIIHERSRDAMFSDVPEDPDAQSRPDPETVGAVALSKLKARVELVLAPVEALRPPRPPEMMRALEVATDALSRKRRRAPHLRRQLVEATEDSDAGLIHELDRVTASRRAAVSKFGKCQAEVLTALQGEQRDRLNALRSLEKTAQEGPSGSQPLNWAGLVPMPETAGGVGGRGDGRLAQQDGDKDANMQRPGAGTNKDAEAVAYHGDLQRKLLRLGGDRVGQLVSRYKSTHLVAEVPPVVREFDADLHRWKVRTFQEILDSARSWADTHKDEVLNRVAAASAGAADDPALDTDHHVASTEAYHNHKLDCVSELCASAERRLSEASARCGSILAAQRRRAEHAALLRWTDTRDFLDAAWQARCNDGVLKACEVGHQCLLDCHSSLGKPPSGAVSSAKPVTAPPMNSEADMLVQTWDEGSVPASERIEAIAKALEGVPGTQQGCAITHGLLRIVAKELGAQVEKLRASLEQQRGRHVFPVGYVPSWG